jgi:TM2 domain-containing membrane protein YozV
MNKLNKIFLIIIILLIIALGYMTYKMFYFKNGYTNAANKLYEQTKMLEDSGMVFNITNDEKY